MVDNRLITLFDINEKNWLDIVSLNVMEGQKKLLDTPVGILASGYAYRSRNARVYGIANDGHTIGAVLVIDQDEEPAHYDLQQLMIDPRFQKKGYGTDALRLMLSLLSKEDRYHQVRVCVNQRNTAALRMCKKAGFEESGDIGTSASVCRSFTYRFCRNTRLYRDIITSDFSNPLLQTAFKQYFSDIGCSIPDWDGLFQEMDDDGNTAYVRTTADGNEIIGFIQFKPITFANWFFEETCGFIREFWIAKKYRSQAHGAALIHLAEKYFIDHGIYTSILTTDTAPRFYEKQRYSKAPGCIAKNQDDVYIKHLK